MIETTARRIICNIRINREEIEGIMIDIAITALRYMRKME
jgi:hypothetical protein